MNVPNNCERIYWNQTHLYTSTHTHAYTSYTERIALFVWCCCFALEPDTLSIPFGLDVIRFAMECTQRRFSLRVFVRPFGFLRLYLFLFGSFSFALAQIHIHTGGMALCRLESRFSYATLNRMFVFRNAWIHLPTQTIRLNECLTHVSMLWHFKVSNRCLMYSVIYWKQKWPFRNLYLVHISLNKSFSF